MYQAVTLTREPQDTRTPAAAIPLRSPATSYGEAGALLALDGIAVAAVTLVTGAPGIAAVLRTVTVLAAFGVAGLYRTRLSFAVLDDLPRVFVAVAVVVAGGTWLATHGGAWLTAYGNLAARALSPVGPLAAGALLAAVLLGRMSGYPLLRRHRRRRPGRVTLLLGCDDVAVRLADALRDDRSYGLVPVGFVGARPLTPPRLPVLAPTERLDKAIRKYGPLHLIVTFPDCSDTDLVAALRRCRRAGLTVHIVPRLYEIAALGSAGLGATDLVNGIPLVRLRPEPAQTRRWILKRAIDVCGSVLGLILLAPLLLVCAIAVRCSSRRHAVLFRQERVGRDGKPFTIMKFRSLTPASAVESQVRWNIDQDHRLGRVGRVLRSSSLDELPQLVNVLRGDMSLVGPRPERPYFVEQFSRTYTGYADRHRVPTGITGWAQIHGLRGDTSIEDRVRFDNHYIEHWSLGLDLKIILRTAGSLLSIHRR